MIQPKELRVGNYVMNHGQIDTIQSVHVWCHTQLTLEEQSAEFFEPIPITNEWLLNLGFKDNSLPERYESLGVINSMTKGILSISFEDGKYYPTRKYDNIQIYSIGVGIEYVHQLQNLYYCLTGEDLILPENV